MGNRKKCAAIVLLEACHRLLRRTWPKFAQEISPTVRRKVEKAYALQALTDDDFLDLDEQPHRQVGEQHNQADAVC